VHGVAADNSVPVSMEGKRTQSGSERARPCTLPAQRSRKGSKERRQASRAGHAVGQLLH
jgi:hypothetical protein